MNMRFAENFLPVIGMVFVILGVLAYYNGLVLSGTAGILWFSYTALFIIGMGIFTRNSFLIGSQLNIILIPYIVWNLDFFYVLFTGNVLWGISNYVFEPRSLLSQIITMQHIFIVPVALFSVYVFGINRKDFWKWSVLQITAFFILVKASNPAENINCMIENCLPFSVNTIPYSFYWFGVYFTMIFLTNFALVKFLERKK